MFEKLRGRCGRSTIRPLVLNYALRWLSFVPIVLLRWRGGRCGQRRVEPRQAVARRAERQLQLLVDERRKQTDELAATNAQIAEINERCVSTRGENDELRAEVRRAWRSVRSRGGRAIEASHRRRVRRARVVPPHPVAAPRPRLRAVESDTTLSTRSSTRIVESYNCMLRRPLLSAHRPILQPSQVAATLETSASASAVLSAVVDETAQLKPQIESDMASAASRAQALAAQRGGRSDETRELKDVLGQDAIRLLAALARREAEGAAAYEQTRADQQKARAEIVAVLERSDAALAANAAAIAAAERDQRALRGELEATFSRCVCCFSLFGLVRGWVWFVCFHAAYRSRRCRRSKWAVRPSVSNGVRSRACARSLARPPAPGLTRSTARSRSGARRMRPSAKRCVRAWARSSRRS